MTELRNNPLITVLLGFLLAAMTAIGAMQQLSFSQLWTRLDSVTNLMLDKEAQLRLENQAIRNALICTDQEVTKIKAELKYHIERYEKGERNIKSGSK